MNAQWGDLPFFVPLAAAVASPDPGTGFKEAIKQVYGVAILLVFRALGNDALAAERTLQHALVLSTAAVCAASFIVVLFHWPGGIPIRVLGELQILPVLGLVRRLRGALEAPEFLGNLLLVAFLLSLALRSGATGHRRTAWTALATLLAAAEFFTYSRSVAGFAIATAIFLGPVIRPRTARAGIWIAALAIVAVVNVASIVGPRGSGTHYEIRPVTIGAGALRFEGQLMSYAALKVVAWRAFLNDPVTGIGPGRFPAETNEAHRRGELPKHYRGVPPHSSIAGRLAETGLIGVIPFCSSGPSGSGVSTSHRGRRSESSSARWRPR